MKKDFSSYYRHFAIFYSSTHMKKFNCKSAKRTSSSIPFPFSFFIITSLMPDLSLPISQDLHHAIRLHLLLRRSTRFPHQYYLTIFQIRGSSCKSARSVCHRRLRRCLQQCSTNQPVVVSLSPYHLHHLLHRPHRSANQLGVRLRRHHLITLQQVANKRSLIANLM